MYYFFTFSTIICYAYRQLGIHSKIPISYKNNYDITLILMLILSPTLILIPLPSFILFFMNPATYLSLIVFIEIYVIYFADPSFLGFELLGGDIKCVKGLTPWNNRIIDMVHDDYIVGGYSLNPTCSTVHRFIYDKNDPSGDNLKELFVGHQGRFTTQEGNTGITFKLGYKNWDYQQEILKPKVNTSTVQLFNNRHDLILSKGIIAVGKSTNEGLTELIIRKR